MFFFSFCLYDDLAIDCLKWQTYVDLHPLSINKNNNNKKRGKRSCFLHDSLSLFLIHRQCSYRLTNKTTCHCSVSSSHGTLITMLFNQSQLNLFLTGTWWMCCVLLLNRGWYLANRIQRDVIAQQHYNMMLTSTNTFHYILDGILLYN